MGASLIKPMRLPGGSKSLTVDSNDIGCIFGAFIIFVARVWFLVAIH